VKGNLSEHAYEAGGPDHQEYVPHERAGEQVGQHQRARAS
jgi:hypothetical protein